MKSTAGLSVGMVKVAENSTSWYILISCFYYGIGMGAKHEQN